MSILTLGRYEARLTESAEDLGAVLRLRSAAFRDGVQDDRDVFDDRSAHVMITGSEAPEPVCTFRIMRFRRGKDILNGYSSQFFDLSRLSRREGPMLELGRFCIAPGRQDPDILRLAWGALTRLVDRDHIGFLFGCSSFRGTDPRLHAEAFALLHRTYQAPPSWRAGARSSRVLSLQEYHTGRIDPKGAMAQMPGLLRSYLALGGKVGDHAVPDPDLGTLLVFTGLDIAQVPPARARRLRGLSG